MRRIGFTLIELVFVIIIMGILSKFGIEFLSQAYKSFIYSSVNNSLQAKSAVAVESIAARLQYRIKDSIIARRSSDDFFEGLGSANSDTYNVLEWVGYDIEGYRGDANATWSGIIDLDASAFNELNSPQTDTTAIDSLIDILSNGNTGVNDAAIYFIGSNNDIKSGYDWNTTTGALSEHNSTVMHPINSLGGAGNIDKFVTGIAGVDFNGTDVYEYYQLAWTAYAVELNTTSNNLTLWYDYQPWLGEAYSAGISALLMENVDTFRFKAVGSVVKIQVCVQSDIISGSNDDPDGGYSLCKEKTIY